MRLILPLLLLTATVASADLRLPSLFSDHMVMQRDQSNYVWGWSDAGEAVSVTFDETTISTVASGVGTWYVQIPAAALGAPKKLIIKGSNTITINDILMGDVWVCSGQSNMEFTVDRADDAENEIANAKYPNIRYYGVPLTATLKKRSDINAKWVTTTPEVVAGFSAVGYYFGRTLHEELDVPIGLIGTSWGGTAIESWISQDATTLSETYAELNDDWKPIVQEHGELIEKFYDTSIRPRIELPETKRGVGGAPNVPSFNYNAMIAPLWRYGIKGAIWYQGESNAGRAYQYRDLMKTMIRDWRVQFAQGDFPFFITQLANYTERATEPGRSNWAELREAQLMATDLPNVGMAVIIDIGDADDIHPTNKQDVGKRLAQSAFNIAYKQDVLPSGPVYKKMKKGRKKITLQFDHVGKGLTTANKGKPVGFQIAGKDQKWVWADTAINGKKVTVWSDSVKKPVAVRYGWANNPDCNLYNLEGLPATPFRTDDWRISTRNRK
ncbi:MAG: sialate O-acetylesterase [Candidatus Hydrogenedentota bacterium]